MPRRSHKSRYLELKSWLTDHGALIVERDVRGFVFKAGKAGQVLVWIDPKLSHKKRVMTLAHEIGHLAKFKGGGGLIFKANGLYSEDEANLTAELICEFLGISAYDYFAYAVWDK